MPDSIYSIQSAIEPGGENAPGSNYLAESRLTSAKANRNFLKQGRAIEKSVASLLASPALSERKALGSGYPEID